MTIRHLLVAGAALVALCLAASRSHAHTPPHFINLGSIKPIDCKLSAGTGTVIERDRVLTANHVIYKTGACKVDGKPARVIYQSPQLDIAVLQVDTGTSPLMPIGCDGVQAGAVFFAVGYAEDEVVEPFFSMGVKGDNKGDANYPVTVKGLSGFVGNAYPGMSGGPVVDLQGRQVAVIDTGGGGGAAGARDLAETGVCAALRAPAASAPGSPVRVPDKPIAGS
jgi:S1-C subfamily serine protease